MIEPTLLDRIIGTISPKAGIRRLKNRQVFEALGGGYTGAQRTRDSLIGWNVSKGDAASDILPDLPSLRESNRDLSRNNPIGRAATLAKTTHTVGTGLKLNAALNRDILTMSDDQADEWEAVAEQRFSAWWNSDRSDIERSISGGEHQLLAYSSFLENGDHFIVLGQHKNSALSNPLALQHIESDRVSNPNNANDTDRIAGGIETNDVGVPIRIHVIKTHPGSSHATSQEWQSILMRGSETDRPLIVHLFDKRRAGQPRGVPHLSPVIEIIKQLGRYTDAEIDAAVKTALFSLIVKTETGEGLAGLNYGDWKETRKEFYNQSPINMKEGSSAAIGLFPDDDVLPFNPERPNSGAEPFISALLQQVGMAIGVPYEVLIGLYASSWSASQAALMQMWKTVMLDREMINRRMMSVIYDTWLSFEIAAGDIQAPGFFDDLLIRSAYTGSNWIGDAKGHINEQQQVAAARDRVAFGFSTMKRETSSLTGEDWDKVRRQREREIRLSPNVANSSDSNLGSEDENDNDDENEDMMDLANG